jgi:hypothetical protein
LAPPSLIRAPTLVTSTATLVNTPRCALKNSSAPFEIAVLPTERLSIGPFIRIVYEFLVDPMPAVMAPPDLSVHQPTRNRSPWDDDVPGMPDVDPCRPSRRTSRALDIPTVCRHLRSHRESRQLMLGRLPASRRLIRTSGRIDAMTLSSFSSGATKSGY